MELINIAIALSGISIGGILGHWIKTREQLVSLEKDIELINQKVDQHKSVSDDHIARLTKSIDKLEETIDKLIDKLTQNNTK